MSRALRLYRPANGTEGDGFMAEFCDRCVHDHAFREAQRLGKIEEGCRIILFTLMFDTDDAEYPHEWRYGDDGRPTCTKFKQKPDNDNGDSPPPPPNDPTQLVLVADPTEDAALLGLAPRETEVLEGVS